MRAYSGFSSEAGGTKKKRQLPPGAYVARIKAAKVDGAEPDQQLVLRMDVCEGEYTDFFMKRYKSDSENSRYEPKYGGDYRVQIPNDENTSRQYPESDIRRFNAVVGCLEKSNPGFSWEWSDNNDYICNRLKGLTVGISMQEDEFNGYKFTKIARLEVADNVRNGQVHAMAPRERKGDADDSAFIDQQTGFVAVETTELPF